ncbi:taste receptor type 2 member 42-like [Camelus dromedarius]|uniref:Taste receptor type 2 n=3 Tax=Camelus TaxID=9836 RepID=A0A8B6YM87_CAMFR|nr:taste receptor type 2 member 42-like [Camelus ferus]XP_010944730.1 taste receptor type 2 member 42-like [Camelus bactrianus]XP_010984523.1 taste receptor type 2 member 42-like [Camelus dromedarius]
MPSGIDNALLAAIIGEVIIGTSGNGFIVLVNCIGWVKRNKFSSVDCILTGLAISRISQLWITLFESFLMLFWSHLYATDKHLISIVGIFWTLSNHLATWCATCLSVFYFLQIASFSHPCFTWLRWRIHRVVLVLLLGSLFLLVFNSKLIHSFGESWTSIYKIDQRNSTASSGKMKTLYLNGLIVYSLICLMPFLVSVTSLLLLFISLRRHTKILKLNPSSRDFSTEAHRRAMRMIISFLLLFLVHFSSILSVGWAFIILQKHQVNLVVMLTSIVFPSGHSFTLILGNSKLRQNALGLLWYLNCHLKRVKPLAS